MIYEYKPEGVCSKRFRITIEDNIVKGIEQIGGCSGNLLGISSLLDGMNVDTVITKLEGIKCGFKNTSCPDQIAQALKKYKKETTTNE